ncbi:MAG: hypothetical protein AAGA36_00370 [Pseudomonadota bacterium]
MGDALAGAGGGAYVLFWLFAFFALILWILMPFAVFGLKKRIDLNNEAARTTNDLLREIIRQNERDDISTKQLRALNSLNRVFLFTCITLSNVVAQATVDQSTPEKEKLSAQEIETIEEGVTKKLKDPYSAKFILPDIPQKAIDAGTADMVPYCGLVNAKNSYGGYTGYKAFQGFLFLKTEDRELGFFMLTDEFSDIAHSVTVKMCRDQGYDLRR